MTNHDADWQKIVKVPEGMTRVSLHGFHFLIPNESVKAFKQGRAACEKDEPEPDSPYVQNTRIGINEHIEKNLKESQVS